jgi:hypothetical protein
MNRDDIIKMAREADAEITNYINYVFDENVVLFGVDQLERFAALIEQHLSYDGIHTCHAECQRPACVAVREAVKAERETCILMLERLHERSGGQYNYYLHAAKVLKGEI